jgi:protein-disulfide isomerase
MRILKILFLAVLIVGLALPAASAQAASAMTPTTSNEIHPSTTASTSETPQLVAATSAPSLETLEPLVLEIIRRNPQVILDSVSQYQATAMRDRQIVAWKENLKNPVKVDISRAPILGSAMAKLTLVEFADFQCPYCIQAHPRIKELLSKYKNQMRYAFLHLPLPNHSQAMPAAQASWAATQQNKFFEYQERLFQLQGNLEPATYEAIAKDLGLDLEKFNRDRDSDAAKDAIAADMKQAEAIGVSGTPTFVLNGLMIRGLLPPEDFETAIGLVKGGKS